MRADDLRLLYDYNYWARDLILRAARGLSDEEFVRHRGYSKGGLRGTLAHILAAEGSWRARWQGGSSNQEVDEQDFPGVATLESAWQADEASMRAYLAGLTDEQVRGRLSFRRSNGEERSAVLWHLLVHVVNHGTQHRAEAAQMLTELGHSPGDIDLSLFLREQNL